MTLSVCAGSWNYWGQVQVNNGAGARLTTDGKNILLSTYLDGAYRAALADQDFSHLPMTGFPLWDASTNPNGFAVTSAALTPQGTIVIAGSPVAVKANIITFNPPGSSANTLPVFYWWDETNQLWHPAAITNKSYPYTGNVGNFSFAPDGTLWTCSGFFPYAYHSLDGGHSYTAFDINARVPANYLPMPSGQTSFGEVFSVQACWDNRIIIGTETGGFLQSTNNGTNWLSLDPNFSSTNSTNPLGRIGDARIAGVDHYGNLLLNNYSMGVFPGYTNWNYVRLIGWRPSDGTCFAATNGLLAALGSVQIVTPPSGVSVMFMNQNFLLQGGVYLAPDGKNWSQLNQGSGLDLPFPPGSTNAVGAGNGITAAGNVVYIVVGNTIYTLDTTPPPVVNRPPVATPQNLTLFKNMAANLTLAASDADGDALNYAILNQPLHGVLTGTPPDLTYTPSNNYTGLDGFSFAVDDGNALSAPGFVNMYINQPGSTPSTIALASPAAGQVFIAPVRVSLTATASNPNGILSVKFYSGGFSNVLGAATNAPYGITLTNLPAGDYTFSARVLDGHGALTWSAPERVTVLPVAPQLTIRPGDFRNVTVTWPLDLDGFYVETAPNPSGPWSLSPYAPLFFTNGQSATIPAADTQFFRLMKP